MAKDLTLVTPVGSQVLVRVDVDDMDGAALVGTVVAAGGGVPNDVRVGDIVVIQRGTSLASRPSDETYTLHLLGYDWVRAVVSGEMAVPSVWE